MRSARPENSARHYRGRPAIPPSLATWFPFGLAISLAHTPIFCFPPVPLGDSPRMTPPLHLDFGKRSAQSAPGSAHARQRARIVQKTSLFVSSGPYQGRDKKAQKSPGDCVGHGIVRRSAPLKRQRQSMQSGQRKHSKRFGDVPPPSMSSLYFETSAISSVTKKSRGLSGMGTADKVHADKKINK